MKSDFWDKTREIAKENNFSMHFVNAQFFLDEDYSGETFVNIRGIFFESVLDENRISFTMESMPNGIPKHLVDSISFAEAMDDLTHAFVIRRMPLDLDDVEYANEVYTEIFTLAVYLRDYWKTVKLKDVPEIGVRRYEGGIEFLDEVGEYM